MRAISWPAGLSAAAASPWLARFAALVMLGLLAWLGAEIFWALTAPMTIKPLSTREIDPQRAAQSVASRHLFGVAPEGQPLAAAAASDIRLVGVVAGQSGNRALAILAIEGKPPQVVRQGEDVMQGITLQRVMPRQVELLRGGQIQTLNLPERGKP